MRGSNRLTCHTTTSPTARVLIQRSRVPARARTRPVADTAASKTHPTDAGWATNAAGRHHNIQYGFGMVDAAAAVELARTWSLWGPEQRVEGKAWVGKDVPADGTPVRATVEVAADEAASVGEVEWVEIYINLDHTSRGDLQLELTSPSGTHSVLIPGPRPETANPAPGGCTAESDTCDYKDDGTCDNPSFCQCDYNDCRAAGWVGKGGEYDGFPSIYQPRFNWKMTTVRAWGESPVGTWTLTVVDTKRGAAHAKSKLKSFELFIYGHA